MAWRGRALERGDPTAGLLAALLAALEWRLAQEFSARLLRDEPTSVIRAALAGMCARGFELLRAGAGELGVGGSSTSSG